MKEIMGVLRREKLCCDSLRGIVMSGVDGH